MAAWCFDRARASCEDYDVYLRIMREHIRYTVTVPSWPNTGNTATT